MIFCCVFRFFSAGIVAVDLPYCVHYHYFENGKFYAEPTLEVLYSLKKKELLDVMKHYKLEVSKSASKAELKKLVLDYLVEEMEPETMVADELHKWTTTVRTQVPGVPRTRAREGNPIQVEATRIERIGANNSIETTQVRIMPCIVSTHFNN